MSAPISIGVDLGGTSIRIGLLMDLDALVLQHLSEGRVLVAGLINMDGELFPSVFKTGPGGNRFLTVNEQPLFVIEGTTKKNLLDKKNADQ